jgi:anti-sigma-K factor RskA
VTTHDRFDELATAYAFDTAEAHEREEFEAHLSDCETCQAAVNDLRRVSAGLGLAVDPIEPIPALRARALAAAVSGSRPSPLDTARSPASRPRMASVAARRRPGWPLLALAASLVVAAGLGIHALSLRREVADLRALIQQAEARSQTLRAELAAARLDSVRLMHTVSVLSARDVILVDLRGQESAPDAAGRAYLSQSEGLVFSVAGMPALQTGRTYQLWVVPPAPGAPPVGVGTFDVDAAGRASEAIALPAGVAVGAVAVTNEPAGGSAAPTLPILVLGTV